MAWLCASIAMRHFVYGQKCFFKISSISYIPIVIINQKAYSKSRFFLTPDETIDIFTFLENYSNVAFD